jgi:hypothetical protein
VLFVRVTAWGELALPTGCGPKFILVGENVNTEGKTVTDTVALGPEPYFALIVVEP